MGTPGDVEIIRQAKMRTLIKGVGMTFPAFRKVLKQGTAAAALFAISFSAVAPAQAGVPAGTPFDDLPDAQPGECFARVMIPAQYEDRYQDVMVDEGGSRIEVSDAQFAAQNQQILIRDAGVRYVVRQPVYKAVSEQIVVRPGYEKLMVEQAQYRNVSEEVVVAPPRTAWRPGKSLAANANIKVTQTHNGEVYCLVEVPAQTKTVSKRVQIRPETVRAVAVAPIYRTITRHVLVDPGGVREVPLDAQYANIITQVLTRAAGHQSYATPPTTKRLATRQLVASERYGWIRVLCKTNATPDAISGVQTHLQQLGFYHDQIDGRIGLSTENAVRQYQEAVGIAHGGYLSLDTIAALREGRRAPAYAPTHTSAHAGANVVTQSVQEHGFNNGQGAHSDPDVFSSDFSSHGSRPDAYPALAGSVSSIAPHAQTVYREGQIITGQMPRLTPNASVLQGTVPQLQPITRPTTRRLTWAGKS